MASLTWTLKAWFALSLPETGRWAEKHRTEKQSVLKMEFKRFLHGFMLVPCQIIRQARRVVYSRRAGTGLESVAARVPARGGHPASSSAMLSDKL